MKRVLLFLLVVAGSYGQIASDIRFIPVLPEQVPAVRPSLLRQISDTARCRQWVDSVMERLTLKERIGQLLVYTLAPQQDKANLALLRKVVKEYKVGGLLFSGGVMQEQAMLTNEAQRMADVPLMITFDGEWGLSMRLRDTPAFPKNMILGCVRHDSLIYEYGREVARQCREVGVQVNFAPVADVNINPRNPVINVRSFGESPENVANKVIAYTAGLESGGVLSVCKHFPGHGDTEVDSHKSLPVLPFSRERLDSVELYPFRKAIRAGVSGVMTGHLEVTAIEERAGVPASLSHAAVSGLLAGELKFEGLKFTDALAMKGVGNGTTLCRKALEAGNDMLLAPRRIKEEMAAVTAAVESGELPVEVINEKCRKVLAYKYALGLYRKPHVQLSGLDSRVNTTYAFDLAQRLKMAAITVLGNQSRVLPLDPAVEQVAVLGIGAETTFEPLMKALSAFTHPVYFRLHQGLSAEARSGLYKSLSGYKRILLCIGERHLAAYRPFFKDFNSTAPMVCLCFVAAKELAQIKDVVSHTEAVIVGHTADEDVQCRVAQVLYGKALADGRLSAGVDGLFPAGTGEILDPQTLPHYIPEEYGIDSECLSAIDTIAQEGIREGAYPGCQIVILKSGHKIYNKAFGTHTWDTTDGESLPVCTDDVYDLASLTKTTATLLAVMKLYDQGKLSLSDHVSDYLPMLKATDKRRITIREVLLHESGLPSTILFYQQAIDPESFRGSLFSARRDRWHTIQIGHNTWANPRFRYKEGLVADTSDHRHTIQVCDSMWIDSTFRQEYMQQIADAPLKDRRYRYSCVGFILLQQVVETVAGMPMDEFLMREFYIPMKLEHTRFRPLYYLPETNVIPSAADPFLRKTQLCGFVHDESAAFQGGVSGNAGLFSTATEVARIHQMLLNGGELDGKRYLSRETCRLFTTATSRISRRGLGFDKPDAGNPHHSPCAPSAPRTVYGHTGFTGTCAWADPDNDLVYVFLCNRTYPKPWNPKLHKLDIRNRIQETLYRALGK